MVNRLSRPTISGTSRISPLYNVLGQGVTNSVLLLGHCDAEQMYEPFQVRHMQDAVNFLKADINSPLLRGLFEAYNAGSKDIWLYAAAPMSEYEPNVAARQAEGFYQAYHSRLATAYNILENFDFYEFVVPLEAPFYDDANANFTLQLSEFCANSFINTGSVSLGVMGTRIPDYTDTAGRTTAYNATAVTNLKNRVTSIGLTDHGKFVMAVVGEGVFMHPQINQVYSRSFDAVVAGMLSVTPINRSVGGLILPDVVSLSQLEFSETQIESLAQSKLNSVVRTAAGRKGASFQVKLLTDNTLGQTGTDFWSMTQMKLISTTANEIRRLGLAFIGESATLFREAVKELLDALKRNSYVTSYSFNITMDTPNRAVVEVALEPMFGIRTIQFMVETGPGD